MRQRRWSAGGAALALLAVPAAAQEAPSPPASLYSQLPTWPEVQFGPDLFDVTGAGVLDLGDVAAILRPHLPAFRRGDGRLDLELVVDGAGAVVGCRAAEDRHLAAAGAAVCAHAQAQGAWRLAPALVLDYTLAKVRVSYVLNRNAPRDSAQLFHDQQGYSLQGNAVRFPAGDLPATEDLLPREAVQVRSLYYPALAQRAGIEARVQVLLTFGETGTVATCRPVWSSNTARMAYETCRAVLGGRVRLLSPPDPRPYMTVVTWVLAD